jgi:hypothetical protein
VGKIVISGACVSEEGGDGEGVRSEAPSLLSYTLRYVSLFDRYSRVPMHLCACVSKEGGDGEGVGSEVTPLLSYTLIYVSLFDRTVLLCKKKMV